MGIKNLLKLIESNAEVSINKRSHSDYSGKIIAIDGSISIYQWVSVGNVRKIVNSKGKKINHIQGTFYRTAKMILSGITPVYVFDGAPPELKSVVMKKRKEARDVGKQLRVPREVFTECQYLLKLLGVPVVQAASEAEAQCAYLSKIGYVHGVATSDSDLLAFGGKLLIRGMDSSGKTLTEINLDILLEQLEISYNQFVDLCIILGSDYAPGISKLNPDKALRLIQKYKTIENIVNKLEIKLSFDVNEIRNEFNHPKIFKAGPFKLKKLSIDDINKLREYLIDIHGLLPNRVDGTLDKLRKFYGL
jgi:flap endonuclease-1